MRHRVAEIGGTAIVVIVLVAFAAASDRGQSSRRVNPQPKSSKTNRATAPHEAARVFSHTGYPIGTYYPLSRDVRLSRGGGDPVDPDVACRADPGAVYCNSLSPGWWQPPGGNANIVIGDDAALAAVAGCELDRYVLKVNGNVDGLGNGPYTIEAALHTSCLGAGGATPIAGTQCQVTLPDESPAFVVCDAPSGTVLTSSNLWVGLRFSRLHCGVAAGAPATKGFSADVLDFPGFACIADLGGFEPDQQSDTYGKHASFYLEIYTRGDCADPDSDPPTEAFPDYKGSNHRGLSYTPGAGIRFADDISLEIPNCFMTAIEVAVKGNGLTGIDLRTSLSDADPVNGGVIPGTWFFVVGGSGVVVGRKDFDPPLPLSQPNLWVGYHTTNAMTGPIITGRRADLGGNDDMLAVYNGTRWEVGPLPDPRHAATDVTIYCAGSPPTGACCDMALTDNRVCVGGDNHADPCASVSDCPDGTCVGDSICRDDLPQMNCPTGKLPQLWQEGAVCAGVCVRGDNDGAPCTRQIDCPGYECVGGLDVGEPCDSDADCRDGLCRQAGCDGPFVRSCGLAACCTASEDCFDLTEKGCFEQPPIDQPGQRIFQRGEFCGVGSQRCVQFDCLGREGGCYAVHDLPGCEDLFCCAAVCNHDLFCCLVSWDEFCVETAMEVCPGNCSGNGDCEDYNTCTADLCEAGSCIYPSLAAGTPCGDPTETPCDHADTCSGFGFCRDNLTPAGTSCGDPTDSFCDHPDSCDGNGECADNVVPDGTLCPDDLFCNGAETCQRGQCVDGPNPCPIACDERYDRCIPRLREPNMIPRRRP